MQQQSEPAPPPSNPDKQYVENYELTIVGWQTVYVDQGAQATLQVRYTLDGAGLANESINFAFNGDSRDARMTAYTARTNAEGVAETVIQAGQITGRLRVEARSPRGHSVEWTVDVQEHEPDQPTVSVLAGTFAVQSKFNIQTTFEGTKVGEILSLINDMSNDPDDPGKFVVDRVLEKVNNKAVSAVADFLRPVLNAEVNKLITSAAPEMIANLKKLAQDISAINRRFEIASNMVAPSPQPANAVMRVNHVLKHIAWELDGKRAEYSFAQLGMAEPTAENLTVTPLEMDQAGLVRHRIQKHTFDLKWGSFLIVALNELVIPNIDAEASNMADLFGNWVNCDNVGSTMNDTANLGGEPLWTAACDAAMQLLAGYFEGRLTDLNADSTSLTIEGETRLVDQNNDASFDLMAEGVWEGEFTFDNATAEILKSTNTFIGNRVQ